MSNLNQNSNYRISLSGGPTLARQDAEWLVEDPSGSSGLYPFPGFSDTWFEEAYATLNDGTTLGLDQSTLLSIVNNTCVSVEYDNGDFYAYSSS
jgi:hypothetical protein